MTRYMAYVGMVMALWGIIGWFFQPGYTQVVACGAFIVALAAWRKANSE